MKRVVITGIGIIAPNGNRKEEYWNNLFSGKSFIKEDPLMVNMGINSTVNCTINDFNIDDFLPKGSLRQEAKGQADFIQYGVAAGVEALKDSAISRNSICGDDVGLIFSSAIGGTPTIEKIYRDLSNQGKNDLVYQAVGEHFYNAGMINYPAILLANEYNFTNICTSISTGCTAGLDAIGMSYEAIKSGDVKVMLAGASEAPLTEITYATLDIINALSVAKGEPHTRSRPFDKTRAGFVISEGSACLVLEELGHALARNATIYGEVLSYASNNNAYHMTNLSGDATPMVNVIKQALTEGELTTSDIDYINAHGSSTKQNDLYETNAFKSAFAKEAYQIPISSTKSMIGHSLSSASMMGVISTIGSFIYEKVHPTAHLEIADESCDLNYVPQNVLKKKVKTGMVTASGFGGIHSVGVFRKYQEKR
ncbi:act minimal PKS ketosynthase (KS/KS alpha)/minimal PKS ketosynthase (KS/KS alpha) [Orenia metallireducens]|uniref:Act minimal PKS ketosynthase (KS/KS alpha)/minimal PKS ketosynthase (KS/KS alpha) n=1 Tax=Orenia metallireducens TaxID=1413210 RepID=A0A285I3F6_9FIRM|nr:beta-ketoacyl-[acyl-carrier-protein] synthase family protein [Orenia metallireducens]PRX23122.1 act minimal PKS ketosynthase (KS/KS alpha)/minimal PKS ketosynthase (KS/KS alpha) [Orenia metallireducens]SNY42433.1 act minimal PKS ketosynthase (KS/KS alpha)/minimal PKS ketosynthase (KS/KS alpha) [Orenia metallireducens]